jgi:antirestriction protein ArdC
MLLHELTPWTRHASRLGREFGRKRWGDAGYAAEELVAELGSAFLCADLGVTAEPRDDHSSYLASWLDVLKNDNRAIFTASAHAQRAADYLHGLQQRQEVIGAAA